MLGKSPDMGISLHRGHFTTEWHLESGVWGSYTGDIEKWMNEGSRNGACLRGIPWRGPWGWAPLLATPKDMLSKVRKWASASIGASLLWNMEGRFFLRAFCLKEFYGVFEIYAKCPVNGYLSPYGPVAYPGILFGGGFNKLSWGQRTERTGIWWR